MVKEKVEGIRSLDEKILLGKYANLSAGLSEYCRLRFLSVFAEVCTSYIDGHTKGVGQFIYLWRFFKTSDIDQTCSIIEYMVEDSMLKDDYKVKPHIYHGQKLLGIFSKSGVLRSLHIPNGIHVPSSDVQGYVPTDTQEMNKSWRIVWWLGFAPIPMYIPKVLPGCAVHSCLKMATEKELHAYKKEVLHVYGATLLL